MANPYMNPFVIDEPGLQGIMQGAPNTRVQSLAEAAAPNPANPPIPGRSQLPMQPFNLMGARPYIPPSGASRALPAQQTAPLGGPPMATSATSGAAAGGLGGLGQGFNDEYDSLVSARQRQEEELANDLLGSFGFEGDLQARRESMTPSQNLTPGGYGPGAYRGY